MPDDRLNKTQEIDERLMASLEKIDSPAESSQWFPSSDKPKGFSLIKPKSSPIQATNPPVTKEPVATPKAPEPSPEISSDFAEPAPVILASNKSTKKSSGIILILPVAIFLLLTLASIFTKIFKLPFIPPEIEPIIDVILALASVPCIIALSLLHISSVREKHIFAGPDDKKPTILEDFMLPIALAIWPFTVALLVALLLFTISSDETTFATLSGIAIFILITGPLSIMLSIILIALTTLYRRNSNVEYPGFIYSAIDWTARKFSKHD